MCPFSFGGWPQFRSGFFALHFHDVWRHSKHRKCSRIFSPWSLRRYLLFSTSLPRKYNSTFDRVILYVLAGKVFALIEAIRFLSHFAKQIVTSQRLRAISRQGAYSAQRLFWVWDRDELVQYKCTSLCDACFLHCVINTSQERNRITDVTTTEIRCLLIFFRGGVWECSFIW